MPGTYILLDSSKLLAKVNTPKQMRSKGKLDVAYSTTAGCCDKLGEPHASL